MRSIYLIELVKYSGFYIILYSWSFIFQNELNRILFLFQKHRNCPL